MKRKEKEKKRVMHFGDCLLYVCLEFFPALLSERRIESHFWDVKLKCYLMQNSEAFSPRKASIFLVFKGDENTGLFCLPALGQPNLLQLPGMWGLGGKKKKNGEEAEARSEDY